MLKTPPAMLGGVLYVLHYIHTTNTYLSMKSPRGNATIIVIIVVLGALVAIGWYWKKYMQPVPVNQAPIEVAQPAESPCGFAVANPLPSSDVSFPLAITGTVLNTNTSSCHWVLFEGQAGTVEIHDANTNATLLDKTPVMLTQMDWMDRALNGQSVDFSVTVPALTTAYTGPAIIIFEEENPSGEGTADVLTLNVNIQ